MKSVLGFIFENFEELSIKKNFFYGTFLNFHSDSFSNMKLRFGIMSGKGAKIRFSLLIFYDGYTPQLAHFFRTIFGGQEKPR